MLGPTHGVGGVNDFRNTSLPICMCYSAEFGRSRKRYERYYVDPPERFDHSHPAFQGRSRSSEPTRVDPPPTTSYQ